MSTQDNRITLHLISNTTDPVEMKIGDVEELVERFDQIARMDFGLQVAAAYFDTTVSLEAK